MKIRSDLIGAVHVGGHTLYAGDTVPRGVAVGPHLATKAAGKAKPETKQDADDVDDS